MRDLLLTTFIFGTLPFIFVRPWIGVLVWSWIGLMNPHRLTWGFSFTMPFAQAVAITTLLGMLFTKERLRIPWSPPIVALSAFIIWMTITTLFAIDGDAAFVEWLKVMKIQLMTFVTLMLITDRKRLDALIWVVAISLGFYGVKGGIYTVGRGGAESVLGPEGSFISGNTEIGLAMIMVFPLLRYLQLNSQRRLVRWALGAAMLLTGLAILGTQSRGALVGGAAMAVILWLKSRKKALLFFVLLAAIPIFLAMMANAWHEKMATIGSYEQDHSAMGRIYAWEFATSMAIERPLTGGGFESFTPQNYLRFAPSLTAAFSEKGFVADAHSIYFQVLGHHGFIGLALFLALLGAVWSTAKSVMRRTRSMPSLKWAYDIAAMSQVSLVGFLVAGAFLGLAYFDLIYTIISIIVATKVLVDKELSAARPALVVGDEGTQGRFRAAEQQ
jgi:probable O-glycosylation ligase (exosortase A-associated)